MPALTIYGLQGKKRRLCRLHPASESTLWALQRPQGPHSKWTFSNAVFHQMSCKTTDTVRWKAVQWQSERNIKCHQKTDYNTWFVTKLVNTQGLCVFQLCRPSYCIMQAPSLFYMPCDNANTPKRTRTCDTRLWCYYVIHETSNSLQRLLDIFMDEV